MKRAFLLAAAPRAESEESLSATHNHDNSPP
jgi:hypothetical protein